MSATKDSTSGFVDYVKAAFGWRYRVPLLGRIRLNVWGLAGLGILGFGNPAFWLLGLALETGYLLFLAGNGRFQRLADGVRLLHQREEWDERRSQLINTLDRDSRVRYEHLATACGGMLKGAATTAAHDLHSQGLGRLLWTFLQLLVSKGTMQGILRQVTRSDLEKEISSTAEKVAGQSPESPLCRSLQGTLDIAKRRLENLDRTAESLKVVDAELDRIEKQVALLREESSLSSDPAVLTSRLDGMLQSVHDTSRWLSDQKDMLGSLDEPPAAAAIPGVAPRASAKE